MSEAIEARVKKLEERIEAIAPEAIHDLKKALHENPVLPPLKPWIPRGVIGWDQVLKDAELGLAQAKARVRKLARSIRSVRQRIAAGDQFPTSPGGK